jgi:hypothetical protein
MARAVKEVSLFFCIVILLDSFSFSTRKVWGAITAKDINLQVSQRVYIFSNNIRHTQTGF